MQNQSELRKAFSAFRESDFKNNPGLTPDILFEDSMVSGILTQLLSEMNVSAKLETAFGNASNIPETDSSSATDKQKLERDDYNI